MLYLDTSVLVPLFVPEPASVGVRRWLERQASELLAVSDWTLTEFASALGIKVREKQLQPDQARKAVALLEKLAADSLRVFTPSRADFHRAASYLLQHRLGLRAGDALHLAVAEGEGIDAVYSLDRRFIAAGRKLKINVASPI
jgi:predicted nucleic acid-binding protein